MVEKFLKELLFEHDCVVLPGFGGFLAHHVSADIHPVTHKFLPPSKKIAFNEQLKLNDGVLISAIAAGENITREEAFKAINNHVEYIKKEIEESGQYVFINIGKISSNVENNLVFEPQGNVNYLEDSFGFSELYIKPIDIFKETKDYIPAKPVINRPPAKKEKPSMSVNKKSAGKGLKALLLTIPVVVLLGAGIAFFAQKDNVMLSGVFTGQSENSEANDDSIHLKEDDSFEDLDIEENSNEVYAEETHDNEEEVKIEEEEIVIEPAKVNSVKYYLVAGAFSNEANAVKLYEKFKSNGVNSKLIEPKSAGGLYKVTVAEFQSGKEAVSDIEGYKKQFGNDLWVLKY